MDYKEATAVEAVLDFEKRVWPSLFIKERSPLNKDYKWADAIIKSARAGKVSAGRAWRLLEKHGGELYQMENTFKIPTDETKSDTI